MRGLILEEAKLLKFPIKRLSCYFSYLAANAAVAPLVFAPLPAMPNLGAAEQDACDIAAYLYALEGLE